ncbi:hypothetical protein C0J52_03257 [Blattella germanica]|nr:hypothetical protein C0J52_03257 [Blattella germanica]
MKTLSGVFFITVIAFLLQAEDVQGTFIKFGILNHIKESLHSAFQPKNKSSTSSYTSTYFPIAGTNFSSISGGPLAPYPYIIPLSKSDTNITSLPDEDGVDIVLPNLQ